MDFTILGPLEIRRNGRAVACKGAKQRLLLATLLTHPNEVVSTDRLIEALWGERPPPTAAKALQVHVSQLRRLLDPELLVTRPPGYELHVDASQIDLERFKAAIGSARTASEAGRIEQASALFAEALALWRGPPLADLTFEESLQPEIARLEELRLSAAEDRIEADLALGRHATVIGELEQLVRAHPLRERLRGQLMLALYRSGRQAEALEQYRHARSTLVDELGIEPGRELKELEARILAQDPALEPKGRGSAVRPPPDSAGAGLIGRERELAALMPRVAQALSGSGGLILIAGEPGIGKSRLADTLAMVAADSGAQVAVGRCWEAGGAPAFWPWVQVLRSCLRDGHATTARAAPELAALLPELRGAASTEVLETPDARFVLFQAVASFLADSARAQPLAVFLDDLHAADVPSLLLLRFVATSLGDAPVLVVGCYRDTDAGPELADAVAELAREPNVERVALAGLSANDIASLLEAVTGEPVTQELAERVHEQTQGNPLFAGELARLLASDAAAADAALPIPEGVRDAIRQRLQRQSRPVRELLTLASVLGREFDLATLGQLGGMAEDDLFAALEDAAAARLIVDVPGALDRFRFSHILVRDALYEDLPGPRRLRLHLRAGEAIETLRAASPRLHVAEMTQHFLAAGTLGAEKAGSYAEQAADVAAAQHAYEEAARYYALALGLLDEHGPADAARECEVLLSLGEVQSRAGDGAAAKATYRRAASIAEEHDWHDRIVRAALAYGGRFAWVRASTDPALVPLLERALAVVDSDDGRAKARLLARLAAAGRDDPAGERRLALADEAVAVARRSGDLVALAYALEGFGVASEGVDPAQTDMPNADELIAVAAKLGDRERAFTGHDFRLNAFWKLSDRAGVDVELEALAQLADDLQQPAQQWSVATERTMLALMEGRFAEAEELIARTRSAGERAERWNAVVSARVQLFVLRRAQGRLAELEDMLARSVHEYPTLLRFRCALAQVYSALDDTDRARATLREVLAHDLGREYVDAEWLFTMSLLPDVQRALGDTTAADALYEVLLPYERLYAHAPIEATFGSIARALGVLATISGRYDDAERHLRLAIDTEQRMGARPWLAQAQDDLATALRSRDRTGDADEAATLLDAAVAGYEALGMTAWAERATRVR